MTITEIVLTAYSCCCTFGALAMFSYARKIDRLLKRSWEREEKISAECERLQKQPCDRSSNVFQNN